MKPIVYTKSRTTKEKDRGVHRTPSRNAEATRFHGAFTGGFSAGFHNTVGSKEGWEPIQHTYLEEEKEDEQDAALSSNPQENRGKKRRMQFKPQRIEDFMDDQDANEWGGPTKIHSQFDETTDRIIPRHQEVKEEGSSILSSKIFNLVYASDSMETIGKKLLRKLGLRDHHQKVAYVPTDTLENNMDSMDGHNTYVSDFLKHRGLKKVNIHDNIQNKNSPLIIIPETKIDYFGIGFTPFTHAPEFELYHKQRKQQSMIDPTDLEAPHNLSRRTNIYRTDDVRLGDDTTIDGYELVRRKGLLSSRSADHGVTTKHHFMGFHQDDDEDNVYDLVAIANGSSSTKHHFSTEYNQEVYDESDQEDFKQDHATKNHRQSNDGTTRDHSTAFADALHSWASIPQNSDTSAANDTSAKSSKSLLPNFVPNQIHDITSINKRWNGPNIPPDYVISRHIFQSSEPMAELKKLSEAMKLELIQRRKKYSQQQDSVRLPTVPKTRHSIDSKVPMTGTTFIGIKEEMNRRFTPSTPSGVHVMDTSTSTPSFSRSDMVTKLETKVIRTTSTWIPQALLCKRFHVIPTCTTETLNPISSKSKQTSHQEMIERITKGLIPKRQLSDTQQSGKVKFDRDIDSTHDNETGVVAVDRPSTQLLQSIFDSDDESEPLIVKKGIEHDTIHPSLVSNEQRNHDSLQDRDKKEDAKHNSSSSCSSPSETADQKYDMDHNNRHKKKHKKEKKKKKHKNHRLQRKEKRKDYL